MPEKILIIDDDLVDREAIRRPLSKHFPGIEIVEAETGAQGLEFLRAQKFDCVFLDYILSDMDGVSLLQKIYDVQTDMTSSPVVMLTGRGSEGIMADAFRWGAQDYIVKNNISADTLAIAIAKAREIFELKKSRFTAEEQRRHGQKMEAIGQLTSGVAHDFNNLLMVILGNTRLMGKRLAGEGEISRDDFTKKVQAIEGAARKGADLVRRLMVFTRQRPADGTLADINTCLSDTVELMRQPLGGMIEIKTVFTENPWPVCIDVSQFESAIINMAVNARDAMPKGGVITIETSNLMVDEEYIEQHPDMTPGAYVMVAISDTGTGMPESVRRRIFDPFFTTKPEGEGTGLGLSMVYGFIKQLGGYIHVYSEPGHGTVFRIYLPRDSAAGGEDVPQATASAVANDQGETILVVEDNDDMRDVAVRMLERLGYNAVAAQDGRTALEILKHEHKNIDLIFTDLVMPGGMSGPELVEKARGFFPGIRALFTSGFTEDSISARNILGGSDIIAKPYRKDMLAEKIKNALQS